MRKLTLILMLVSSPALAGQQEVADSLKAIDREIVRFRYYADVGGVLGFLNVDGTLPAAPTAPFLISGAHINITTAGSYATAPDQAGLLISLLPGYTGSAPTRGLWVANTAAGVAGGGFGTSGNIGIYTTSQSSAASAHNIAIVGLASNTGASGTAAGGYFRAINSSNTNQAGLVAQAANGSGYNIGIYGGLNGGTPTIVSAGIIAETTTTAPSFLGLKSGVTLFELNDNVYLGAKAGIASPVSRAIYGEPGLGADKVGGSVSIHSGIGTGAGAVSSFQVLTPEAHGSDSTAQTEIISFSRSQKDYSMGDDVVVSLFTVVLPTNNTGCSTHISFSYQATGGGSTVSHAGTAMFAFSNNAGTVTGTAADTGEVIDGTGCGPGCDTFSVTAAGTTATAKVKFNNTLSVTGSLRYGMVFNSCQSWTRL